MSVARLVVSAISALSLAGCAVTGVSPTVEEPAPLSPAAEVPASTPEETVPEEAPPVPLVVHRVAEGETLFGIARLYGITTGELVRRNHLADPDFLEIGERLVIPTAGPEGELPSVHMVRRGESLSRIARHYGVTTSLLLKYNNLAEPDELAIGDRLFVPSSAMLTRTVPTGASRVGTITRWPLKKMIFLSEFGDRNGRRHNGVDLGAPRGTPIHAMAKGIVTRSGWLHGYGRIVVIEHEDGVQTLYAHNEENLVELGQEVKQGDVIATIGHTGNASAYHVHFEYILNGKPVNPRLYLPKAPG